MLVVLVLLLAVQFVAVVLLRDMLRHMTSLPRSRGPDKKPRKKKLPAWTGGDVDAVLNADGQKPIAEQMSLLDAGPVCPQCGHGLTNGHCTHCEQRGQ